MTADDGTPDYVRGFFVSIRPACASRCRLVTAGESGNADNVLTRKLLQGLRLIAHSDMRVSHCHFHVLMPGEFLGLGQRCTIPEKFGNVRVASGGVEIGETVRRLILDASGL